tara:strand:- start:416 stop:679 length:264 start_codon:yes stop_codon:yes gene_type:complete
MKPLRKEVIVKEIVKDTKTESGIILEEDYHSSRDKTITAKVLHVADQVKTVKVNDIVLIGTGGYKTNIDNEEVIFMNEPEIMAILQS